MPGEWIFYVANPITNSVQSIIATHDGQRYTYRKGPDLLTSAAMEGGYRNVRVVTKDGRIVQGLIVSRDADAIVFRKPNTADTRIPFRDITQADFTGVSIMPEGLLESMPKAEVSDLFARLKSLTGGPPK